MDENYESNIGGIFSVTSNAVMAVHLSKLPKQLRTRTTLMLIQISTADLLTCLTVAPAVGGWSFVVASFYLVIHFCDQVKINRE